MKGVRHVKMRITAARPRFWWRSRSKECLTRSRTARAYKRRCSLNDQHF